MRQRGISFRCTVAAFAFATTVSARVLPAQQRVDSTFAGLVARLSDSGGYFDSDNIITNEASYLQIGSQLTKTGVHGGVYLGVGPDQNFSYIALIKPQIAFMIDVRRDNLLEHLLFKSLFALSRNRAEYLCLLFGKALPPDVDKWNSHELVDILGYVNSAPTDSVAIASARKASNERIASFGIPLDDRDRTMIERYRKEFIESGLDTRYSSIGRDNRLDYPSFAQLAMATDREGRRISYLATESAFQFVRAMQLQNRIVPIVGNVAGTKALHAVAQYATEHHENVEAFYLSNVEQYLMGRDGGFDAYAQNVKLLPHDASSVIIRSYFGRLGRLHPLYIPAQGNISTSMIESMDSFIARFSAGEIHNYADLVFNGYVKP